MTRKVFCVHCGYEVEYEEGSESSRESAVADMTRHELECPENPAAKVIAELAARVDHLESALETERMRLAACSTAALGYFTECSDEYKSASLSDVLELRAKHDKLLKEFEDGPKYEHLGKPYSRRMLEDENKRLLMEVQAALLAGFAASSQGNNCEYPFDGDLAWVYDWILKRNIAPNEQHRDTVRNTMREKEECTATCASDDESACLGCLREYGVQE